RRLLLMLFCFGIYWWKKMNGGNGDLFFWLGVGIIVVSILLLFVLHVRIRLFMDRLELGGSWTTKPVVIFLKNIRTVARTRYSKYHLNNPVFNLKWKNEVRFYTDGTEAIEIVDEKGTPFRIGSHSAGQLEQLIRQSCSGA
ncbi:MAG: hypothetical protein ACKO1U_04075, partial [Bacteroidota bacterium]